MNDGKLLLTIAARSGSRSVKNKNIRVLCDVPLMAHTIMQAKKWGKATKIVCSTDSRKIASIARAYGAETPFLRPRRLATDIAGKLDVLRHALIEAEKFYNMRFDIILDLDVTAPIRKIEDIENIVNMFKRKRPDCIFSVVRSRKNPYFNMVEIRKDGTASVCKKSARLIKRRQDAPLVYEMNASMYVYKRDYLLEAGNNLPYSKKTCVYEMAEVSAIDIDTELDFKFIEFLVKKGVVRI